MFVYKLATSHSWWHINCVDKQRRFKEFQRHVNAMLPKFNMCSSEISLSKKCINSLTPGRFQWNFVWIIFKLISVIDGRDITCEIVLRWISLDLSDVKSILVQVMAWCRQATSHYLNQCWPRSLSPYDITRPQRFNGLVKTVVCPLLMHWSK